MSDSAPTPLPAHDASLLGGLRSSQARLFAGIVALLCILYVAFALTPSSYALAYEYLGLAPQQPLLGTARYIRTDEWMVFTPYIQIAVGNDFGQVNAHSAYHESLRTFQALPLLDWGLLFKPYHWAFFLLPAANAYSFFFMFMAMAFLCGWALFLRQLRLPALAAMLVSVTLFFAPFVQVWWTSNAGAFALAPWAAVAWLRIGHRGLRIAASAYALAAWLVAVSYPPFIISSLLAMAVLVLAFRRDAITLRRLFDAAVAGAIALAVFVGYFHDIIPIVRNTVYPGQRQSAGGGVGLTTLLAHLFPNLMTYRFAPLPLFKASNDCEIAVLGSLLPLFTVVLADGARLRAWAGSHRSTLLILAAGLLLIACWIFLPIPAVVGKLTGLSMVPPARALLAFGLLLNIGCAMILLRCGVRLERGRLLLLAALLVAGSLAKFLFGEGQFSRLHSAADALPYLCLAALAIAARRPKLSAHAVSLVLGTAALANLLGNGLFNPVQPAGPIFAMDRTAVLQSMQARGAHDNAEGVLVAPGGFGGLLAGVGIPAVNHVLYLPQLDYFRRYFPAMQDETFNFTFNRYHHITVATDSDAPRLLQGDLVEVPASVLLAAPPPSVRHARDPGLSRRHATVSPTMGTAQSAMAAPRIAVVIPCYRVTRHVLSVLAAIDDAVTAIYCVDDACPDGSGRLIQAEANDPRVTVLFHEHNRGVGGAIKTGYRAAIADGMDILVKVDGDGQMDPALLMDFVTPIAEGHADYTKGNRFWNLTHIRRMPPVRRLGNLLLSFMTKASSGYWQVFDPTNGYTAIHARVASHLKLDAVSDRYFFETDMLFRLNTVRAVVQDVAMDAHYGDETSNLRIGRILGEFTFKHMRNTLKRIAYNYFLRDLSIASLELVAGSSLLTFGGLFGLYHWIRSAQADVATPVGTIMITMVALISGLQFLLAFVGFDIANVPRQVLNRSIKLNRAPQ